MTWRAAMAAAFLAIVGRGRWWLAALAGFLVRGGVLAFLPAILVIPTPAELARYLDPRLTGASPGEVTPALVELATRVLVTLAVALLATTAAGVWLEGALVADAAIDGELEPVARSLRVPLGPAVAARLAAHLPTLVAVIAGGLALAAAAYAELVSPTGSGPLPGRVAARAPLAVVAIAGAWLLGEAWGGLAVRRLGAGDRLLEALWRGILGVIRPTGLATLGVTTAAVGAPALALGLAEARAFDRLWPLVVDRADPAPVMIALGLFVVTWAAGLWLLAIGLAFRSVAWTAEALRVR